MVGVQKMMGCINGANQDDINVNLIPSSLKENLSNNIYDDDNFFDSEHNDHKNKSKHQIDIGKIKRGEKRDVVFNFTNTGTANLEIEVMTA